MPTISIDIPTALVSRVVAAMAKQMNVDATGLTGAQQSALVKAFYKQKTVDAVKEFELPQVVVTATLARSTDIDTNVASQIT